MKPWASSLLTTAYAAHGDAQRALRLGAAVTAQQASPEWLRHAVASLEPKFKLSSVRQPHQHGDTQPTRWESSDLAELVGVPG